MPESHDYYANARNLAMDILRKERVVTPELIQQTASKAAQAQAIFDPTATVDVEKLTAELRHLFSVGAEDATALDDFTEHEAWLPSRRADIQWRFWNRYMTYLERDFGMPPAVVGNLDDLTNMVLERLEDPKRPAPWDRRGMVVGSVQSGKTANYTGLICKALDAGYKLVIVLAGIHSNLRAQTQLRIDEAVLGFDTQKSRKLNTDNRWVGVGKLPGERLVVHSLTSSAENGDFNKTVAENIGVMLGGDPVVLVVKKNSKLLANLLKWVQHVAGSDEADAGKRIIKNVPLLLIDDEADNASINYKAKPGDDAADSVAAINGRIREILDCFEKSTYVGYTATPFANIFINPDSETEKHGKDLFPRSFIINVKAPSNYVGPAKVFGLDGDPDSGIASSNGMPVVREIDDYDDAFPPKHKIDHVPPTLPDSLKRAIRCFILTCAARRARGQENKHNSMLVHVTRFVGIQQRVVELVSHELKGLQLRIEMGDGSRTPTIVEELEQLWNEEFVPVTGALGSEAGTPLAWAEVQPHLHPAAAKIVVLPINGFAKEALDYKEHEADGRSVIAVGGNKLSRGLTLEGLSISYFLRNSRMYDTLMQMGRWFGYRPGYLDLCRLFTTRTLKNWYRHIALAEEELRREFDYMVAAGLTPENYGLRVRTHPGGMIVTALNKMSHGQTRELKWAGILVQTRLLPKKAAALAANLEAAKALINTMPNPPDGKGRRSKVWRGVPSALVVKFLEALQLPPAAARATGEQLAAFVSKQASKSPRELEKWTVVVVSNAQAPAKQPAFLDGLEIGLIERTPEGQDDLTFSLKKANILNPEDEGIDFENRPFDQAWLEAIRTKLDLLDDIEFLESRVGNPDAWAVALQLTRRWQSSTPQKLRSKKEGEPSRPNGRVLRVLRRPDEGLLLIYPVLPPEFVERDDRSMEATELSKDGDPIIGFAISFPTSETTLGVEYRVNKVWGAEMAEDEAYDD